MGKLKREVAYKIHRMGERIIMLTYPQEITKEISYEIKFYNKLFLQNRLKGILQVIPAMNTLSIRYNPLVVTEAEILEFIQDHPPIIVEEASIDSKIVYVPISFAEEYALDLNEVAGKSGISNDKVIEKMLNRDFYVYLTGFIAGTPYLGEVDSAIELPRKNMPRLKVAAGSVGIANNMCTIYTLETPGGWNIIGWTPMKMFNYLTVPPTRVSIGDYVRFKEIPVEEAKDWDENRQEKWDKEWNG